MTDGKGRRWGARALVVSTALAAATALSAAVATSASAHRPGNPAKLCDQHEGVADVGKDFVLCNDGEMIDL
jgi:hypothetical protein